MEQNLSKCIKIVKMCTVPPSRSPVQICYVCWGYIWKQNKHITDSYRIWTGQNGQNRFKAKKEHKWQSGAFCYRFCACSTISNIFAEHQQAQNVYAECWPFRKWTLTYFTRLCSVPIHFANPVWCDGFFGFCFYTVAICDPRPEDLRSTLYCISL